MYGLCAKEMRIIRGRFLMYININTTSTLARVLTYHLTLLSKFL